MNRRFRNQCTPLMVAARAGSHAVIPVLLSHGAGVHETDSQGCTVFHYLCRYGQGGIITGSPTQSPPVHYWPLGQMATGTTRREIRPSGWHAAEGWSMCLNSYMHIVPYRLMPVISMAISLCTCPLAAPAIPRIFC